MPTAADEALVPGGLTVRIDSATGFATAAYLGLGRGAGAAEARQTGGVLNTGFGFIGWDGFAGNGGTGSYFQTGGTYNVAGNLHIAYSNNSVGTYTISGGALNAGSIVLATPGANALGTLNLSGSGAISAGVLSVGNVSTGVVNQDGGILTLSGDLDMAVNGAGSSGSFNLSAGSLNVGGNAQVGGSGSGYFLQTGGAASFSNALRIGVAGAGDYVLDAGTTEVGQQVLLGQFAGSSGLLRLNGGTFTAASIDKGAGTGNVVIDGGTLIVDGGSGSVNVDSLTIGDEAGRSGRLTLSGTASLAVISAVVGDDGNGTFVQNGGINTIESLDLGYHPNSNGDYNLGGTGSLSVHQSVVIGRRGNGTFVQEGGSNSVVNLFLALQGGAGTYALGGTGQLTVSSTTHIGFDGNGAFAQDGGVNSAGALILGENLGSSGAYTLSGMGNLSVSVEEFVGLRGIGTFTQSGGTHTVNGRMYLGYDTDSTGTYLLSGGALNTVGIDNANGIGRLLIDGGTLTVGGGNGAIRVDELRVGDAAGSNGSHTLSGVGIIEVAGTEYVGYAGTGSLSQNGESTHVAKDFYLGYAAGSAGTFNLSGSGALSVASVGPGPETGTVGVGYRGTGVFTQRGASSHSNEYLFLGIDTGGTGSYELSESASLNVGYQEIIGQLGSGSFLQSGGTHQIGFYLTLGEGPGAAGYYGLSDSGVLSVGAEAFIGTVGSGMFIQSGGSHGIAGALTLGVHASGTGTYRLTGGTLTTASIVDGAGHGSLILDGGTLTVGSGNVDVDELRIGDSAGRAGGYTLAGPGVMNTRNTLIGVDGFGALTQSGGVFTASTSLTLGAQAGGSGSYRLNGGTSSAASILDGAGHGLLVIDGGSLDLGGGTGAASLDELRLGDVAGRTGAHTLSGGSMSVTTEILGNYGSGVFTQTGGTHTVSGVLTVAAMTSAQGSYLLGGGSLNAALVANNDRFSQTGGTFSGLLQNNADFSYAAGSFLGRLVNNGNVTLNADLVVENGLENNTGFPIIATGHSLTLNGQGLLNSGEMVLAGGTLTGNGVLVNAGVMSGFGTIAGTAGFVNTASLTQSGGALALSNTGANQNAGFIDLAIGRTFTLAGATVTLTNTGSVNLNSGSLNGTGLLTNAAGGVVTGRGSIGAGFANAGTLEVLSGTTTVSNAFANTGSIELTSAGATLKGGAIGNAGVISGRGVVQNAITNTGVLRPLGGRITVSGALNNPGTIEVGGGSELLVSGGLASNPGAIALSGGRFDNGSHALTNTGNVTLGNGILAGVTALSNASAGVIAGQGALETTNLDNAGQLLFSTGSSYIHGSVLNATGGRIVVTGSGGLTFYDLFENQSGAELKVASLSSATFFGDAILRSGSLLTGDGSKFYEAGLSIGNSPGSAFDAGNVTFGTGNVYEAEIAGLTQGSQFDYLNVGGRLTLGGTLQLTLLDGYAPALGDSFDLFDFGSVAGGFALFDLGRAALGSGLAWDVSALGTDGTLRVVAAPVPLPPAAWCFGVALGLLTSAANRRRQCV